MARGLAARARRKALVVVGSRTIEGRCAGVRPLSFIARPWCDVLDVASNPQSAFAWHTRERHYAGCLSGGGAAREVTARARRAAPVAVVPHTVTGHYTGERLLSLRCKIMVRFASCGLQHTGGFRVARARAALRCLSLGRRRSTRASRAHAPCRAGCVQSEKCRRGLHRREAIFLRCKTLVRRASYGFQRTAGFRAANASAPLRCLSLGGRQCTNPYVTQQLVRESMLGGSHLQWGRCLVRKRL